MKHLDLCSGIGGFALAARWMGWETVGFAEIDPFANRVLAKHWPGVPNYGDISAVPDGIESDIITAGVPCQPYSCAGKQLGAADDRAIWPLAFDVVCRSKPHWVVIENVAGFIGLALDSVLSDLESEGYETGTVVLPACAVNAPHRRERVWIVANAGRINSDRRGGERGGPEATGTRDWIARPSEHAVDVADPTRDAGELQPRQREDLRNEPAIHGETWITARTERTTVSNSDREPLGRATEPRSQRGGGEFEPGLGGAFDGLPGWLDGPFGSGPGYWDGDWERGIPRVTRGVKDRAARLKALGNAIVPQVAYQIFKAIGNKGD